MKRLVTDYVLYRWRYILGYSIIGLGLVLLLGLAGLVAPGGISDNERRSAIASSQLSLPSIEPSEVINLPYRILQSTSIDVLGLTELSIKLPSLLIGLIGAVGIIILLRTWFRRNVAVITTLIVITTGHFLYVAQNGTPAIMYILWSVLLLTCAMFISRQKTFRTFWKVAMAVVIGFSLYTPLTIYILVALFTAALLHPHLRYILRRASRWRIGLGILVTAIIISPLMWAIVQDPSIAATLLGIPSESIDLSANLTQLYTQYLNFSAPMSGTIMTPVYGLGSALLIALGLYRLITAKYTARSYVISAWLLLLLPILIMNPSYVTVTFVPFMLLIGLGIELLIKSWYGLFPLNPYARVAGLLPLSFLVVGLIHTGIDRYTYGYLHDPEVAIHFSRDLRLVNQQLYQYSESIVFVGTTEERAFYEILEREHTNLTVSESLPDIDNSGMLLLTRSIYHEARPEEPPYRILTSSTSQRSDRFYIYQTASE